MSKIINCDLAIIGGGAGGLSLASGASQLGLNVVLIESNKMGGDCLNYGCVPSKSLLAAAKSIYQCQHKAKHFGADVQVISIDFQKVMKHVKNVISALEKHDSVERFESLGVTVIQAHAQFLSPDTLEAGNAVVKTKRFVVATGSSPFVPPINGLESVPYLTNETIFDLNDLPSHLIVVGGGPIGCELAQAFAMLGSQVTIVEAFSILPKDDEDCVAIVRDALTNTNVNIHETSQVKAIKMNEQSEVHVQIETPAGPKTLTSSHILIATGRQANVKNLGLDEAHIKYSPKGIEVNAHLQTSNKKIYALGDVASPYQFTHVASYHAGIILRNIVFKLPAKVNYQAVPWVTYTSPEISHVGKTATDIEGDSSLTVTEWSFDNNDRAHTEMDTIGKIKVITDKKAKIVGATIVHSHAGELILPWVIAIREGKTLRSFTDTICPYPTLSEASKQVAGAYYTPKLFSKNTRRLVSWLKILWW